MDIITVKYRKGYVRRMVREVDTEKVREAVAAACEEMAYHYSPDILAKLHQAKEEEVGQRSRQAMEMLVENAEIAASEHIPICQDTGLVTVYVHAGQDVRFINGSLKEAIQQGVAKGYTESFLRASVVADPLFERRNTGNNTPAVIYCDIEEGDHVRIELTAKGFGSENMSRIKMLKPAEGIEGAREFVLETIRLAGPNACPPMVVGVGIGGTFDYSAFLAKRALLKGTGESHPDARYQDLERQWLKDANRLKIGPMGLHGKTTVLSLHIETAPTHIAGLPCAVNICCHACRHKEITL